MTDPPDTPAATISTDTRRNATADTRRQRWLEVCLVLLVAFGGPVLGSLYILGNAWKPSPLESNVRPSFGILHELTALLLLAYVLSRRGLRFGNLGLRWSWRDVGVGLLVTGVSYAAYAVGSIAVHQFYYRIFAVLEQGASRGEVFAHPYSLAAISFSLLNPFFEELIVRAYLMTEVAELTGSSTLAVCMSVAVQFFYHLYYGPAEAISLSFMFLVFALYYAQSRRALPIILAHGIFDIWALISFR